MKKSDVGWRQNLILTLLIIIYSINLKGQECANETLGQVFVQSPGFRSDCLDISGMNTSYIIPVAVHVIKDNFGDWPTDNLIDLMISTANTFLKPNFTLVPVKNPANCNSNSFRPQGVFNTLNASNELEIKNLSRINPNLVCNIWLVRDVVGGKAFAYNPWGSGITTQKDGIVIGKDFIFGSTLAHELGHYFGLHHVWGVNEGDPTNCYEPEQACYFGDEVEDTPRSLRQWPFLQEFTDSICSYSNLQNLPNASRFFCVHGEPIPCHNLMGYSFDRDSLTPGQRERMIYTLNIYRPNLGAFSNTCLPCPDPCIPCYYGTPVTDPNPDQSLDFCSPCHPDHEHITNYNVTGNVIYNDPMLANQTINIKSGGKLTISNFVYFNPGIGINVESGGTLELSGGHLTACSINWGGVSMVKGGNVNIINGGTISKALYGVYKLGSNSGGILTCNNAHFYDNVYGVLLSRTNVSADFKNTTFTGMAHGVYLDNLPGKTNFSDCSFAYQTGNSITSFGSSIDVSSNNTITGSDNGVAIYNLFGSNTQSKIGDELLANTISNCNKGVYAVNAELLIHNNYLNNNSFSLYYSGQNIFQSASNTFTGHSYAEGIYSTGKAANQSHDNQYSSDVGIFPYLYNSGYTFYNNCFRTQWWDVNVPSGAQISTAQEGPNGSAASNCFTKGGVTDFICESNETVFYKIPIDTSAQACMIPENPGNYVKVYESDFSFNNCGASSTGVSEYDYIKKIGCDSIKLRQKTDSLNTIIKALKIKLIPLTNLEKATLSKSERHLRYAINQWAWCLKNRGRKRQLKEWYTEWSIAFPDDIYYKIKRAEVSSEMGMFSLAKSEIDTLKSVYPSKADIWDAIKITIEVQEAINSSSMMPHNSEPAYNLYQEIAKVYSVSQSNHMLLRRVAAMTYPEAAYGRALLAYLTGETIEPLINYDVIPRAKPEKTEIPKESVHILPNPAIDNLNISIKNATSGAIYTYELWNALGQKVVHGQLNDQNNLNVSLLSQGIYIMIIHKDRTILKTKKLVIQR